ncbi:MAG TPA: methyltransferase domain-containing protein [Acidimicrobiales bacterium]|nr:methyltransferase domain-containing protein [Acidimicrobiales bacterium]
MSNAERTRVDASAPGDAFGRALWDWVHGGRVPEIIERDDGYFEEGAGPEVYLSPFSQWPRGERRALGEMRGRVLDVGCGAGRVALELQARGFDVVGLDASTYAARAARHHGVKTVWRKSLDELGRRVAEFDSIVMFGNNFGLFASAQRAKERLSEWARLARPDARLFVESTNAYGGGAPGMDRTYYRQNRERGRLPGELRARYRYDGAVGGWFTWLFVSRAELSTIVRGTGWRVGHVLGSQLSEPYVAVLELD